MYLKAKEELWKLKYYFTMAKKIIIFIIFLKIKIKINPLKETKILQDIYITLYQVSTPTNKIPSL
jgi:hypothetical protein